MRPAPAKTKADPTASFAKPSWLLFIGVLPSQTLKEAESVFPPATLGAPDPRMTTSFFRDGRALREKAVLAGLLS